MDIAELTVAHFAPLVGQSIEVTFLDVGRSATATIKEAKGGRAAPIGHRTPFSVYLDVPDFGPKPQQGMVRLTHASFGAVELFAVPVGKTKTGYEWQIVFG